MATMGGWGAGFAGTRMLGVASDQITDMMSQQQQQYWQLQSHMNGPGWYGLMVADAGGTSTATAAAAAAAAAAGGGGGGSTGWGGVFAGTQMQSAVQSSSAGVATDQIAAMMLQQPPQQQQQQLLAGVGLFGHAGVTTDGVTTATAAAVSGSMPDHTVSAASFPEVPADHPGSQQQPAQAAALAYAVNRGNVAGGGGAHGSLH